MGGDVHQTCSTVSITSIKYCPVITMQIILNECCRPYWRQTFMSWTLKRYSEHRDTMQDCKYTFSRVKSCFSFLKQNDEIHTHEDAHDKHKTIRWWNVLKLNTTEAWRKRFILPARHVNEALAPRVNLACQIKKKKERKKDWNSSCGL